MTIRRQLSLSFLAILFLLGLNLIVYFWGNQKRNASVEILRRAISRQILVASINQHLNDIQTQVALLSQVMVEAASSGAGPEEIAQFTRRLDEIRKEIDELQELSDTVVSLKLESLKTSYRDLSASWRTFFENFGVNQSKAIMELATRGDPLSQRVVKQLVPQLQEDERHQVEAARLNFYDVARLTDRIAVSIFILSTLVAVGVAYWVSRRLSRGLGELRLGAALIGGGHLDHRIVIQTHDELSDLAHAFNDMTENLHTARKELEQAHEELARRHEEVEKQRLVSESLLLNILPAPVAKELEEKGTVDPKYYDDVTIMFADFVGFTLATERLAAEDLVYLLHDYFSDFDRIVTRYGLEKLKTIGDSYMCVAGMPVRYPSHPVDTVLAAFEMVRAVTERAAADGPCWAVRIGIHTGPVIAGVVGIAKFAFDIWGESVNYSSRMETGGAPNRINLSERTHARVKDFFECEYRGKQFTKEKKEFEMYFANGILPSLLDDCSRVPPPSFLRRYRVYFQKDPPAFPAFLLESQPTSSRNLS